jgi:hypothetical protein
MEADISIWRKTGHFYFALTRIYHLTHLSRPLRHLPVSRGFRAFEGPSDRCVVRTLASEFTIALNLGRLHSRSKRLASLKQANTGPGIIARQAFRFRQQGK